jgi:hypothetical protein
MCIITRGARVLVLYPSGLRVKARSSQGTLPRGTGTIATLIDNPREVGVGHARAVLSANAVLRAAPSPVTTGEGRGEGTTCQTVCLKP